MPVSGLVLSLTDDAPQRALALAALHEHAAIEVGEAHGSRIPIVVDTANQETDMEVFAWLGSVPGILFVDLVCTDSSEDGAGGARSAPAVASEGGSACTKAVQHERRW